MSSEALTAPTPLTGSGAADEVLAAAGALVPEVRSRASEIEAARRVPLDLLDQLVAAGCFRLLLPPSHDGHGAAVEQAMDVLEALAGADASVAWTVMIGSGSWIDLAGLPRASFDDLFTAGPDTIVAGAFAPSGSARPERDGYRVAGRWGFASGCEHATWLFGNCLEGFVDGEPSLRIAVVAPEEVTIEDTWDVVGLCGTGSHHLRIDDVLVPKERTTSPITDEPSLDTPIVRIPPPALFSVLIASVAIGNAQGALRDVVELSHEKEPLFAGGRLDQQPTFRLELGAASGEVAAARALLHETAASMWERARDGEPFTLDERARARMAAVHAVDRATAVVGAAYRAGGGSAIYRSSPLQRRLRDAFALTQHFLVRRDALVTAGGIFAGDESDPGLF